MKVIELLKLLEKYAREYKKNGIAESVIRNSHMNEWDGFAAELDETLADAVLVDFINFVAMNQGVDYGMYTKDLKEEDVSDGIVPKFDN